MRRSVAGMLLVLALPSPANGSTSSLPSLLAFVVPAALLGLVFGRRHHVAR